jgi:hypothetical protein
MELNVFFFPGLTEIPPLPLHHPHWIQQSPCQSLHHMRSYYHAVKWKVIKCRFNRGPNMGLITRVLLQPSPTVPYAQPNVAESLWHHSHHKPGNVFRREHSLPEITLCHLELLSSFRFFCIPCTKHIQRKEPRYLSGIALGYGQDDRGSIPGRSWEFFFSPPCPDRLWGPPSLLANG